jgi:N-methylhydantoinase A/oxoprolinase/acetone carboxylase beta subunit
MGRIVLHEFSAEYTPDDGKIDLRRLQIAVHGLMEKGADAIQRDGHDLDDVIFDRFAVMRYAGDSTALTVPIEFLTDAGRLVAPFHASAQAQFGWSDPSRRVEIIGLKVEVVADPDAPVGGEKWR